MATIDIGKIKPVFKGTYDNSTAYVLDDIVYYNGSSYVAKTSTTGNLPTDTTKWNILASGSGGIWDSTLSIGSAGQSVKVNSGGTALEFGTISSPIIKTYHKMFKGGQSISGFNYDSPTEIANYNLTITPQSTSSVFLATYNILMGSHTDHTFIQAVAKTGSGSYSKLGRAKSTMDNDNEYYDFGTFRAAANSSFTASKTHSFYYAPATTSAITFALFCGQHSSTAYFGRSTTSTSNDYTGLGMTIRVDEYTSSTDLVNTEYTSG